MADPLTGSWGATASSEPATTRGYVHQLGIHASDEGFRDLICPFALGGLDAGEAVVMAYGPQQVELLQRWLPDVPGLTYVTDMSPYESPAKALVGWRRLIEQHLAADAPRVRITGKVPHPGDGRPYAGWDRYEAAVDRALGDLPVWALCLYDARIAPDDVLETAAKRHRHFVDPDGRQRANDSFAPVDCLSDFLTPEADPLQRTTPTLELIDPMPSNVRAAVSGLGRGVLSGDQCAQLVLAASEAVANAFVHGVPPVTVRTWLGEDRVVITVHDHGTGPTDPLVGLLPRGGALAECGRGLWLAHQLNIDVALIAAGEGFTVRLRAGAAEG